MLYFESETLLKLYNLEARLSENLNLLGDFCFFWHYINLLCFLRMPITMVTMQNCVNLPTNVQWVKSVSTYLLRSVSVRVINYCAVFPSHMLHTQIRC